ncbi:nucleotide sugar dehydrogenase [Candidatus Kuenenbacteria bacterium]|nr:nucleotide sugar dehydrogenase [Candidatus Kuenenbacteria bacterium]
MNIENKKIVIVGLGYVGLPLAIEFGKQMPIVGFDINEQRVNELINNHDCTGEHSKEELENAQIEYSTDPTVLKNCNFIIVAVPTPIDQFKKPDLSALVSASEMIGENLSAGSIIVFESTVYPGVTEDVCAPIIEKSSGLKWKEEFKLGYSPERTVPGDAEHTIDKVVKIVSGEDEETLDKVSEVYSMVCKGGIYKAPDIKTAEAAKVIENVQRDLNIAIVNELSMIFNKLDIKTREVLKAAGTKWNFHGYEPGLVGGHCIGVDPFYLTNLAESIGYTPQVILAGRRINDSMSAFVAELTIKGLIEAGKPILGAKALILGLTFKEDVSDTRNSKVKDVIDVLKQYGLELYAHDPNLNQEDFNAFGVNRVGDLNQQNEYDCVLVCVPHKEYKLLSLQEITNLIKSKPVVIDIKSLYAEAAKNIDDLIYKAL